jgi:PTH1 family peptidyl-tRNA hydrolase
MKLIVGLGNPGEKYSRNRHNIGFMAVDEIARGYSFGPWKKRFQGYASEGQIGVKKCIILKPGTYMNESGRSAGEAMRFYKLPVSDVIVVHDELDLKPGTVRVKTGGGNAGHNGLKSLSAHIGNEYARVRLGIGHPGDKALVSNYVLQDFAKADREWLEPLLEGVARGMARLVEGSEAAFLSEAARGRAPSAPAAALNGASAPEPAPKKTEATASIEAEALAAIAAAASRPIQAMPVVSIPVVAIREGGSGGAVSRAVMMPEPKPLDSPPDSARAPVDAKRDAGPAASGEPVTDGDQAARSVAAAQPEHSVSVLAEATPASKPQSEPEQKKKGGLISSWFRSRIRGGVTH